MCIPFLQTLFITCLRLDETPLTWGKANPKTRVPSKKPSEYRGISLQSVIAKTYCRLLNYRLRNWIEFNNILNEEQNGFRPGRNCQDHIFALTSIIENRIQNKKDTFACFIDFRKAFDTVNRKYLWAKLEKRYGMSGGFLHSLKSMYNEVSCSIKLNDQLTDWFPINNGVKQGCLLSPTLFSLYIEDLVDELKSARAAIDINSDHVAALLYADDIVLLARNEESLQLELDIVYNWCRTWGISINISKTKVMHFRKKHHLRNRAKHVFKVGPNQLEYSHDYRYLGLYINEHLDWSETLEHIVSNAQKL